MESPLLQQGGIACAKPTTVQSSLRSVQQRFHSSGLSPLPNKQANDLSSDLKQYLQFKTRKSHSGESARAFYNRLTSISIFLCGSVEKVYVFCKGRGEGFGKGLIILQANRQTSHYILKSKETSSDLLLYDANSDKTITKEKKM